MISLSDEIYSKLKEEKNASGLINNLLKEYYESMGLKNLSLDKIDNKIEEIKKDKEKIESQLIKETKKMFERKKGLEKIWVEKNREEQEEIEEHIKLQLKKRGEQLKELEQIKKPIIEKETKEWEEKEKGKTTEEKFKNLFFKNYKDLTKKEGTEEQFLRWKEIWERKSVDKKFVDFYNFIKEENELSNNANTNKDTNKIQSEVSEV